MTMILLFLLIHGLAERAEAYRVTSSDSLELTRKPLSCLIQLETGWTPFGPEQDVLHKAITDGKKVAKMSRGSDVYTVHLNEQEGGYQGTQINDHTSKSRNIICLTVPDSGECGSCTWQFLSDTDWQDYAPSAGLASACGDVVKSTGGRKIDFQKMMQTNLETMKTRPIRCRTPSAGVSAVPAPLTCIEKILEQIDALPKAEFHIHLEMSLSCATVSSILTSLDPDAGVDCAALDKKFTPEQWPKKFTAFLLSVKTWIQRGSHSEPGNKTQQIRRLQKYFQALASLLYKDRIAQNIRYTQYQFTALKFVSGFFDGVDLLVSIADVSFAIVNALRSSAQAAGVTEYLIEFIFDLPRGNALKYPAIRDGSYLKELVAIMQNPELNTYIRGVGLGGRNEADSSAWYRDIFKVVKENGGLLNIHAGECNQPKCQTELEMTLSLEPERIGHGVKSMDLLSAQPGILEKLKKLHGIDVCISSNVHFFSKDWSSLATHPVKQMLKMGLPVVLGTDDPSLIPGSSGEPPLLLKDEYRKLFQMYANPAEAIDAIQQVLKKSADGVTAYTGTIAGYKKKLQRVQAGIRSGVAELAKARKMLTCSQGVMYANLFPGPWEIP